LFAINPLDFVSYPWSHGLVAQIVWGAALGVIYFMMRREGRGAIVLAACVPSHWLLDYVMHRPDMPLYPGGARYGLGLWNSLEVTLAMEFGMFAVGAAIYLSSNWSAPIGTRPINPPRRCCVVEQSGCHERDGRIGSGIGLFMYLRHWRYVLRIARSAPISSEYLR
jgi:hypothetical protein